MTRDEWSALPTAADGATPRQRSRITDVAFLAGVSIKTVSRVANDEKGVLPATRDRVRAAIRELGYVPDSRARALKRGDNDTIGILIDAISDQFFAAFVSVIEDLALECGVSVVFASTGCNADREREQLARLTGHRLRGLIIAPVAIRSESLALLRRRFPVICVDRSREGIDSVVVDDFGATVEATRALIALGHHRIAFIGERTPYPTVGARLRGFRAALADAGLPFDESLLVTHERDRGSGYAPVSELLHRPDPPTAVFCATSPAAVGAIGGIRAGALEMPALISFGDFELAGLLSPGITCVDQDPRLIGEATFRRLLQVQNDQDAAPAHIVVPTKLIRRGSGELLPRGESAGAAMRAAS